MAGIAFETKLWAKIVLNGDLHSVALLVVSTKTNLTGIEGRCGPSTPGVIFLRGSALRRMQMALGSPSQNPLEYAASSLPICLSSLAGWEQVRIYFRLWQFGSDFCRFTAIANLVRFIYVL